MILDRLDNISRYEKLHSSLKAAIDFIHSTDLKALKAGRHEIRGDRMYASVSSGPGRARGEGLLEIHREYIDIQIVLEGVDEMGWKPASSCIQPDGSYSAEKDIQFFRDEPDSWIAVHPGQFTIFYPEDAHLPLVSAGNIHKVVIKVGV